MTDWLVARALARLPEDLRTRYAAEWQAAGVCVIFALSACALLRLGPAAWQRASTSA